jgi:uncharacterized protein involved in outer membrane biogenesis
MKLIRRLIYLVFLLVVVAGVVVFMGLDRIIRSAVQTEATSSLNLQTTLGGAALSLFGGKLGLHDLEIASPEGYTAPHMMEVGDTNVAVSYGQLRGTPVHINSITIDKPKVVIEQKDGVFNFKKAMDQMPKSAAPAPQPSSSAKSEPLRLIIDELKVTDAQVVIRPNLAGMTGDITVPVSSLTMKNIGSGDGSQNGAAVKDVVMQVISALAASASSGNGVPNQLKGLLQANVGQVMSNFGPEVQKQITSLVPGDAGQAISQAVKDPAALIKDPSKALEGLLGEKKKK